MSVGVITDETFAVTEQVGFNPRAFNLDPARLNGLSFNSRQELGIDVAGPSNAGTVSTTGQTFAGAKRGAVVPLTSSGNALPINIADGNNFSHTTTENTTLSAPSNAVAGQHGSLVITQGATPRTLGFASAWKFAGGTAPTLTASAGAVDVLTYYVAANGFIVAALLKDVK